MLYSYAGKVLKVDLCRNKIQLEPLPLELAGQYLGGKGLGTYLLLEEIDPRVDPLSPDNALIICTGPATGTAIPHKGYILVFKSPLTGIYASSSSGGSFADELKYAGYDILIVKGRSKTPVYLWIDDDRIEIRNAGHLWGKDTFETNELIKEELGDNEVSVLRIGPAGEKLVKIAGIFNDQSRTAGRCGAGAVMGNKNLKAIAVRGTGHVEVADMEGLLGLMKELHNIISDKMLSYRKWGTPASISTVNELGVFPTKYFRKQQFAGFEEIDAETIREKLLVKSKACYSCSAHCGKLCEVLEGPYKGAVSEIDFETIWAFGALCANSNIESIVKANELCDRLGIDTISAGNLIAFAMECYDRKLITKDETEGIELTWGNHVALVEMVERIALRKGLGPVEPGRQPLEDCFKFTKEHNA